MRLPFLRILRRFAASNVGAKSSLLCVCLAFLAQSSHASVDECIINASVYHRVNSDVLRAILGVESNMKSSVVRQNKNGTFDIGIGQINSVHLKELSKYNIGANELTDPCIGTFVSAWHLSKQYRKWGNTWFAVGAYHSQTPYYNQRYQWLVYNQLMRNSERARATLVATE